jgi:DNA-binding IclR family transcriptional regulator
MSAIQDFDITKERIQLQDMLQEIRDLLNNGNLEIEVTTASQPAFDAPQETKMVISIFGTQYRFYISYLGDWYHTTLTKL